MKTVEAQGYSKEKALEATGLDVQLEMLKNAGLVRLRPIIMTTLAMIFGMIPTAIATGTGTEMRAPMAQSIIGGLISSTILTLFVVPIVYSILDDLKNKVGKFVHKKSSKNYEESDLNL